MKFTTENDQLVVTLDLLETVLALKHRLTIPRGKIVSLEWQPEYSFAQRLWRTGGSDIPGALWAGHFRGNHHKYFLYLRSPRGVTWTSTPTLIQNTLVINTKDYTFKHILLTCDPDIGASLLNWWRVKPH